MFAVHNGNPGELKTREMVRFGFSPGKFKQEMMTAQIKNGEDLKDFQKLT